MNVNPLMMALQMAQSGRNPMQMLQSMMGGNPAMRQALSMIAGRSPQQLRTVAENMARERGMDLNQLAQSMGLTLPK